MPRYHFHLKNGDHAGDITDRELADDATALRDAKVAAVEALADETYTGRAPSHVTVTLERSDGEPIAVITARLDVPARS